MTSISETIKRLTDLKAGLLDEPPVDHRLGDLEDFGSNPGTLAAKMYVPSSVETSPALVVVLHGCTQTAAIYDHGSGWSRLAEKHGFLLLYPEQRRQNNANLCFNWFEPGDTRRGSGEALSISQMVATVCREHLVDPNRVYVTGLSAGGAMANVMLATYPDLFSGGAIIAGLAYDVASTIPEAFERMRGTGLPSAAALSRKVLSASPHVGPWPTVSIWQGTDDHTVVQANATAILDQWPGVHGLTAAASAEMSTSDKHRIDRWQTDDGFVAIELHCIEGMGHGTPIDPKSGIGNAAHSCSMSVSRRRNRSPAPGVLHPLSKSATTRRRRETAYCQNDPNPHRSRVFKASSR